MHNELITMRQYLFVLICLMSLGFGMIISAVVWKILRKKFIGRINHSEVFYTKDDDGLCNGIENSNYEIIDVDKRMKDAYAAPI